MLRARLRRRETLPECLAMFKRQLRRQLLWRHLWLLHKLWLRWYRGLLPLVVIRVLSLLSAERIHAVPFVNSKNERL